MIRAKSLLLWVMESRSNRSFSIEKMKSAFCLYFITLLKENYSRWQKVIKTDVALSNSKACKDVNDLKSFLICCLSFDKVLTSEWTSLCVVKRLKWSIFRVIMQILAKLKKMVWGWEPVCVKLFWTHLETIFKRKLENGFEIGWLET